MIKQQCSKLSKNQKKFIEALMDYQNLQKTLPEDQRNIFPCSTDAQLVVDCLADLLLGEDWYVVDPLSISQVNTLILDEILYKYSKEYHKICRRNKK